MSYTIEPWDQVRLTLTSSPYGVPLDPLGIVLDFTAGAEVPLPWVLPSVTVEVGAPLQRANSTGADTTAPISRAVPADHTRAGHWQQATPANRQAGTRHQDADQSDDTRVTVWGDALDRSHSTTTAWGQPETADRAPTSHWNRAETKDRTGYASAWIMKTPARDATGAFTWFTVNLTGTVYDDTAARRALQNTDTGLAIQLHGEPGPFTPRAWDAVELRFGYTPPKRPIVPHDQPVRITARQATPRDDDRRIPWGAGDTVWRNVNLPYPVEPNDPDPEPTDPPERRTVYLIMNTLQVTDVATGTPLDVQNVRISLDIDSLSWQFSASLYGQGSLSLIQPDGHGMKDIDVTINTHSWRFSIERYTSDERFPTLKYDIQGVSRTQYMAAPFAPTRSHTNDTATTAAQAATAELQNTGFTLTWPTGSDADLPDWPLPAGALSYRDKSPAQVIAQIVTAAGGVLIPHRASDGWTVQPRSKIPPWQWDTATPDAEIYIGMVRSRSAQYEPGPAFNACYVSGIHQGVAVDVQRQGSGGTQPMPDIYDDLITDTQPAISRGKAELSAAGNKVIETLSVLIPEQGAAPGILTPGQIVKVTHDDPIQDYTALVLANRIAAQGAGAAAVYQSVTLERIA